MANFFKNYGIQAYKEKHKGEQVEEIKTANLEGFAAPNPRTLKNRKQSARNRALYGSVSNDENN